MKRFIITVARGFGTGGKEISTRVAKDYGIECYENRILKLASQMSGISESEFQKVDEKMRQNRLSDLLKKLPTMRGSEPHIRNFVSDQMLFDYQVKIIRELAKSESCVIVGKCADFVLKDFDNVLRVYIEADREHTRSRIMRVKLVGSSEADELITKTDEYRAKYYEYYSGGNYWTNPVNYDITLNSGTMGYDGCVYMIEQALKCKLGIPIPEEQNK